MAVLLLAAAGCTRDEPARVPSADSAQLQDRNSLEPAEPDSADKAQVRVVDEQELAAVIEGYRGEVVLVDFWATWCLTCIELFPHTVSLHERFAGDGLRVISVSFDQPESQDLVLDFLRQQGATFDNFISRYGASVDSPEKFELPGTLPQLLLYDRQGELAYTFPEPQSPVRPDAIDQAVKRLLESEP